MTLADQVEAAFLEQPQADCPVTHRFGPGIYIREVLLPRGAYVVGHAHKTVHLNIMPVSYTHLTLPTKRIV